MLIFVLVLLCIHTVYSGSSYDTVWENIECGCTRVSDLDVSLVQVYVYNYAVEPIEESSYFISDAAQAIFNRPDFDSHQCIDIFIPGYNNNIRNNRAETARCIFSQITCNSKETLAIIFDHSEYTRGSNNVTLIPETYRRSVLYTKSIGKSIGEFIVHLLTRVDAGNINLIGHGLGGHMVGYAAETVRDTIASLPIVYATDPAGPCFQDCPGEHVRSGQADVVVSFRCTDVIGTNIALADYDFFSNGGKKQDGCVEDVDPIGMESQQCSHYKCIPIAMSPAIDYGVWPAKKCVSFEDYEGGICDLDERTTAGYRVTPVSSPGLYHFVAPPYPSCDKSEL